MLEWISVSHSRSQLARVCSNLIIIKTARGRSLTVPIAAAVPEVAGARERQASGD